MRKKLLTAVLTATMALAMSINALAYTPVVGWKSEQLGESTHWHYDKTGYGNFAVNEWLWIDGNGDGVAECYNFDGTSFMRMNTTTPDGYTVNADGAWVVDGVVQTKQVGQETAQQPEPEQNNVQAVNLLDMTPTTRSTNAQSFTNGRRTVQGELWSKGYEMYVFRETYMEFYAGGEYNTFTATIAPREKMQDVAEFEIEVYGDDDVLLSSESLNYKTSPITMEVDISGQNYVKIVAVKTEGYDGSILFKNAQFK